MPIPGINVYVEQVERDDTGKTNIRVCVTGKWALASEFFGPTSPRAIAASMFYTLSDHIPGLADRDKIVEEILDAIEKLTQNAQ